jgi:hypothetical protein
MYTIHNLKVPILSDYLYTVSGQDMQETLAVIEWRVESTPYTIPAAALNPLQVAAQNCTPYLIACYNSHLEIKAGHVVSTIS